MSSVKEQIERQAKTLGVLPRPIEICSKKNSSWSDDRIGGPVSHLEILHVKLESGHIIELRKSYTTSSCMANCDFSESLYDQVQSIIKDKHV